MKALVTGGSGFIGSHIISRLLVDGWDVVSADLVPNSTIEDERLTSVLMDVTNIDELTEIGRGCDIVFHLAANTDIRPRGNLSRVEFEKTMLTTYSVLECVRCNNINKLFFASSSAVYGSREELLREDMGDLNPVSYYGAYKLTSESAIKAYSELNGRDYPGYEEDIVRYFSGDLEVEALEGTSKEKYFGNRELFDRLMDEEMEKYSRYIKKYTDSKENIYIVDATTEKFSSQNLIEKASGKKTRGLYYTLLRSDSNDKAKGFNDGYRVLLELTSVDLPEFLMTSNENPVHSMDHTGHPIYSKTEPDEWYRGDITSEVTRGIEDYARTLRSIFGKYLPSFEYDTIGKWTRSLARNMSEFEYSKLKELKWASDPAHLEYHNLFFSPSDAPLLMVTRSEIISEV